MANAKDSLIIQKSIERIEELEKKNAILEDRIDVLNDANNKILNTTYWTIGVILSALFGLTIWNAIKTQRINSERFKYHLDMAKNDINSSIDSIVKQKVEQSVLQSLSNVDDKIKYVKRRVNRNREDFLISRMKSHPFYGLPRDMEDIFELIDIQVEDNDIFSYENTLQTIKKYLEQTGYIYFTDKNKFLEYLEKYFSNSKYSNQVNEIKSVIGKLDVLS